MALNSDSRVQKGGCQSLAGVHDVVAWQSSVSSGSSLRRIPLPKRAHHIATGRVLTRFPKSYAVQGITWEQALQRQDPLVTETVGRYLKMVLRPVSVPGWRGFV